MFSRAQAPTAILSFNIMYILLLLFTFKNIASSHIKFILRTDGKKSLSYLNYSNARTVREVTRVQLIYNITIEL